MLTRCYLEITNSCNLDCVFCPGHDRAEKSLTLDEFNFLTDRLQGRVKFLYFHLMGEPCSHPLLPEFIAISKAKGFIPVLTTNGTLLGAGLLESLPYKVNISLHAFEGNGGQNPTVYLDSVCRFAQQAQAKGCIVVLRLWNEGGLDSRNREISDFLKTRFPCQWVENKNGFELATGIYLEYDSRFLWPDSPDSAELTENACDTAQCRLFCYALRNQIGVLADGTVVPCCLDHNGRMALGNLFHDSIDTILASARARSIYDGFTRHVAVEPMCRGCGYAGITKQYRTQHGNQVAD